MDGPQTLAGRAVLRALGCAVGPLSLRPPAVEDNADRFYYARDRKALFVSTGEEWVPVELVSRAEAAQVLDVVESGQPGVIPGSTPAQGVIYNPPAFGGGLAAPLAAPTSGPAMIQSLVVATILLYFAVGTITTSFDGRPRGIKDTKTYLQFATAATTNALNGPLLPAAAIMGRTKIKHSQNFQGGAIASYTIGIGVSGTPNAFATPYNVKQAVGSLIFQTQEQDTTTAKTTQVLSHTSATQVIYTATSTGANLDAATQGSADLWMEVSVWP